MVALALRALHWSLLLLFLALPTAQAQAEPVLSIKVTTVDYERDTDGRANLEANIVVTCEEWAPGLADGTRLDHAITATTDRGSADAISIQVQASGPLLEFLPNECLEKAQKTYSLPFTVSMPLDYPGLVRVDLLLTATASEGAGSGTANWSLFSPLKGDLGASGLALSGGGPQATFDGRLYNNYNAAIEGFAIRGNGTHSALSFEVTPIPPLASRASRELQIGLLINESVRQQDGRYPIVIELVLHPVGHPDRKLDIAPIDTDLKIQVPSPPPGELANVITPIILGIFLALAVSMRRLAGPRR